MSHPLSPLDPHDSTPRRSGPSAGPYLSGPRKSFRLNDPRVSPEVKEPGHDR